MNQPNNNQPALQAQSTSGLAIAALILGILALATSFVPIVNNVSCVIGILGLILAIVGFMGIRKGKKKGKGIAIAGLVINILAVVVVLATQSMYSAAIDEATSSPDATVSQSSEANNSSTNTANSTDTNTKELAVGTSITTEKGLVVTVDEVMTGLKAYDGSAMTGITVTYVNNGSSEVDFASYDWKGQDKSGALRSEGFYDKAKNQLSSGSLAAGGSVTGNIYFEGNLSQALYYGNLISDEATASWVLS